jgi:phosphoglycerate dehydrogenase-like enzyme
VIRPEVDTVLIASDSRSLMEQAADVRGWFEDELPGLSVHFAGSLDEALAAPPPTILLTNTQPWLVDLVRERPSVRWLHLLSAGADRLLTLELPLPRLLLSKSSGVHAATIAEYVMAGALYHAKAFGRFAAQQRERRWERAWLDELEGRTIGIVGLGAIGQAIATRAAAFGMRVIGSKRTPAPLPGVDEVVGPDGLHDLLRAAAVLAVTVPLTPATRGLIGRRELALMKPSAILINVARGEVVDEAALAIALRKRRLRGAVLDVFEVEPLPVTSPLWGLPSVLVTPHVAGTTPAYMRKAVTVFAENYRAWQRDGRLTTPVDLDAGY